MDHRVLSNLASGLLEAASELGLTIVTAESCTAGRLGQLLADTPGAGLHFHGGFVTYTKTQKTHALGVPEGLLRVKGAVCLEVANLMAEGALTHSPAEISIAITGVAGPEPDEDGNPVGRVCIAVVRRGDSPRTLERRYGNLSREIICERAMTDALTIAIACLTRPNGPGIQTVRSPHTEPLRNRSVKALGAYRSEKDNRHGSVQRGNQDNQ
jgi:nicotinamide-nucleotide amidase